jgi:hypothetical protein
MPLAVLHDEEVAIRSVVLGILLCQTVERREGRAVLVQ